MQGCLEAEWIIAAGFQLPHRSSVRAHCSTGRTEGVKVSAGGYGRDREFINQVADGNLSFLFQHIEDLSAALLGKWPWITVRSSHVASV